MHRLGESLEMGGHKGFFMSELEWGSTYPQRSWHHCPGWGSLEGTATTPKSEIILREDVPIPQAREEIIDFLKQNPGEIFISEIIQELRLDLESVIEILEQLYDEGYIDRTG